MEAHRSPYHGDKRATDFEIVSAYYRPAGSNEPEELPHALCAAEDVRGLSIGADPDTNKRQMSCRRERLVKDY